MLSSKNRIVGLVIKYSSGRIVAARNSCPSGESIQFQDSLVLPVKLCREGVSEPSTADPDDGGSLGWSLNQSFHHVFLVYRLLFWLPDGALTAF